ncbi:Protease HtpX [Aquisphaera giovannonii]|uniref:Protease HtpX n=1 Tax=Aquisphaera giovannonii TaxID=406548 RepID=A0A5B9WC45_9BACT|nr:M48 family metallopeptidase [Aquisphaera giovannonii]QEH38186.1 Protease HtpX [Aquisphaera giovannonii]
MLLVAALSFGLGGWVASRVARAGYASGRVFRRYVQGSRLLTLAGLGIYAWIVHGVGWSDLVLSNWKLEGSILLDDLAIFAPYIVIQLVTWSGLYLAERALHDARNCPPWHTYLTLKTRQAAGLTLPVILIFVLRHDVFGRLWPGWHEHPAAEPVELACLGFGILFASPLFIRLAWPTRRLPDGPLRRRLERVAGRVGFRITDFLVWDTGGMMVNACVTGVLPWFRYVLLSDALIESLSPAEVAAVFGHEVGHVAHRHLPYFGFFFMGSLALMSLAAGVVTVPEAWVASLPWIPPDEVPRATEIAEAGVLLAGAAAYFWLVFGHLSRRFERQADVFGCKVVSCGDPECPPHFDYDEEAAPAPAGGRPRAVEGLCPVGIEVFTDALSCVARHNGMDIRSRSWRHGSIAGRIAFLRGLQADPRGEPAFQRRVRILRASLGAFLLATFALAVLSHSWEMLP